MGTAHVPTLVGLAAVLAVAACRSTEEGSPVTSGIGTTSTIVALTTTSVTATTTLPTIAPAQVQRVEFSDVGDLLPDLTVVASSATHIVELQNRTLTVSVAGSMLCVGGGDLGLQPDTCADLTAGPGIVAYTDDADTRVSAVLTAADVTVGFPSAGGLEFSCYSEPISAIGPLVLSWCENEFPPVIRFEVANGPHLEAAIG